VGRLVRQPNVAGAAAAKLGRRHPAIGLRSCRGACVAGQLRPGVCVDGLPKEVLDIVISVCAR
jgi:hypothetical protein